MRAGDYDGALLEIRRVLMIDPKDEIAFEFQNKLGQLSLLKREGSEELRPDGTSRSKQELTQTEIRPEPSQSLMPDKTEFMPCQSSSGLPIPDSNEIIQMMTQDIETLAAKAIEHSALHNDDLLVDPRSPSDGADPLPTRTKREKTFSAELWATAAFILLAIVVSYYMFSSNQASENTSGQDQATIAPGTQQTRLNGRDEAVHLDNQAQGIPSTAADSARKEFVRKLNRPPGATRSAIVGNRH
jgi:hypothetical protein